MKLSISLMKLFFIIKEKHSMYQYNLFYIRNVQYLIRYETRNVLTVTVHGVRVSGAGMRRLQVQNLCLELLVPDSWHSAPHSHSYQSRFIVSQVCRQGQQLCDPPSTATRSISSAWCCHLSHVAPLRHAIHHNHDIISLHLLVRISLITGNFLSSFPAYYYESSGVVITLKNALHRSVQYMFWPV
jgi:hypothetical protein